MRTIRFACMAVVMAVTVGRLPASAQTILNNTTLAAAVNATSTTISLTSASNVTVGDLIVIPGIPLEAMRVTALSGAIATVVRGLAPSAAHAHDSGVRVFTGVGSRFQQRAPDTGRACTRSAIAYLPWIDMTTGIAWTCDGTLSSWRGSVITALHYASSSLPLSYLNIESTTPAPSLWDRVTAWVGW